MIWWWTLITVAALLPVLCSDGIAADRPDAALTAPLLALDPDKEDYIRVNPAGRYFVDSRGRAFIPIGYNHNPDWQGLIQSNPSWKGYDPTVTADFFARLNASGVNLVRLMLETPGSGLLEDPIGTFDPKHVEWIDNIVRCARGSKVRLMVTPWDTFWMNHRWNISPYSAELGGPVAEKIDFIVKREVLEAQKRRFAFIIDRWGNSGTIFAWELLNEGDIWWGANARQLAAWTCEMADFVRCYELRRWGRNHLVALSTAMPMPRGSLGKLAFESPCLDMATTHLYIGASRAPDEAIGPALAIAQGVGHARTAIKDNRPYLDSENGPIDRWIADGALDNEVFHAMSWAHLASGGAGSGLRWPYRHPHHLSNGMLAVLSAMRKFSDTVAWDTLAGPAAAVEATADGWISCCFGTPKASLLWLLRKPETVGESLQVTMKWAGGPTRAAYRAVDTFTATEIATGTAEAESDILTLALPQPPRSVVVLFTAAEW